MFFSIVIFEMLLNRQINVFIFDIFVVNFCDDEITNDETTLFNTILTIYTKTRTSRRNRE